jgi:cell division protein ZapA (FtsZ GTPase activity inhibitor)
MNGEVDLQTALRRLIEEEAPSELPERLRWLCKHLDEYLGRWLGFAELKDLPVEAILTSKLFLAVLAGINVMAEYLETGKSNSWCPVKEWKEFTNAVEWIRRRPDREELAIVESTFEAFSKKLSEIPMF